MDIPLTTADISGAKNGCYECSLVLQEIERQKACGLDCQEAELRTHHLNQFFQQILDQYGPLVKPTRRP